MLLVHSTVGCAGSGDTAEVERGLRRAREAFVAGDYAVARDRFRAVAAGHPDIHEAVLGEARSLHQLQDYDAALARYREAIERAPTDALTWANYVRALHEGGVLAGNGERLRRVLEVAETALAAAPDRVEIYEHVQRAAAELNRIGEYVPMLERVVAENSHRPVPRIELAKARNEDARRARNAAAAADDPVAFAQAQERLEALEAALRTELEEAEEGSDGDSSPGQRHLPGADAVRYQLAVGYELLGASEKAAAWLEALEESPQGRDMAAPRRYEQFLGEWVRSFDADPATRVAVAERWLPRFAPRWTNNGARYRAIRGMQFDVMVSAARNALAPASGLAESPGTATDDSAVSEAEAEELARVGRELARIDTGRRAARYVETTSVLALVPFHYVTAVRLADEGIEALQASHPGLLHGATHADDRQETELRYIAVLLQLKGQALHNLGRGEDAERVLREAIALYPVAGSYAVLGGLLLDQERAAEAFDLFVAALARGFSPAEAALEQQTRASAREAAALIGASPEVVDQAIAFAAEMVAEERDRRIVADPLNTSAPDFELSDTDGYVWRLSELRGQVVVLNFWATWCAPCIVEMPYYQRLVNDYENAGDVAFLAISTDADAAVVVPFLEANGYHFDVLHDDGAAEAFGISGVPASFVIGKDGLIKYRTSGFPGPERYLREMRLRIDALRGVDR